MNLKKYFKSIYGKPLESIYFDGDMKRIRSYYDLKSTQNETNFYIDDITWHDLNMDEVFKKINHRITTPGEQYLYYLLRSPTLKKENYKERLKLIEKMEQDENFRLKVQLILGKLGRSKNAQVYKMLESSRSNFLRLLLYFVLVSALILFTTLALWQPWFALISLSIVAFNIIFQEIHVRKIEPQLDTVNYTVHLIKASRKLNRLTEIRALFPKFSANLGHLKSILRFGFVPRPGDAINEEIYTMIYTVNSVFLLNLTIYELGKSKIVQKHKEILFLYDMIGMLDASISIASYRASLCNQYTTPKIDFNVNVSPFLDVQDMAHPLLKDPVKNDVKSIRSALITGSNASGESTYLKSILVNMIMAQSIGTVLANSYKASSFKMFSSMSISDDLLEGDSYFVAELKAVKRIMNAMANGERIFAVIDEVLRGTNTIERIATSSALLLALTQENILCFSATHDMELCELLEDTHEMLHFNEFISENGEVIFDYKVKPGIAISCNAIKLLKALEFDDLLVSEAEQRSAHYIHTKEWK